VSTLSNLIHNSVAIQSITARVEVQTGELGTEKLEFSSNCALEKGFLQQLRPRKMTFCFLNPAVC
jgi:hypothetical protein